MRRTFAFYFTHFPGDFIVSYLWGIFRRWGKVIDAFISSRRNKSGRRFGFVRFSEVEDESVLEYELNTSTLGIQWCSWTNQETGNNKTRQHVKHIHKEPISNRKSILTALRRESSHMPRRRILRIRCGWRKINRDWERRNLEGWRSGLGKQMKVGWSIVLWDT